ncbi:unnamed protein product, partial [Discosporangium mesarthrocarpum]
LPPSPLSQNHQCLPCHSSKRLLPMVGAQVIQFGYVSMFSVAFPLAPLLALVNNKFEFMLDLKMLVEGRRPHVHVQSSIGSWRLCLQAIAYVSCFTNILIAVLMSENIELYVPS